MGGGGGGLRNVRKKSPPPPPHMSNVTCHMSSETYFNVYIYIFFTHRSGGGASAGIQFPVFQHNFLVLKKTLTLISRQDISRGCFTNTDVI